MTERHCYKAWVIRDKGTGSYASGGMGYCDGTLKEARLWFSKRSAKDNLDPDCNEEVVKVEYSIKVVK